jgi:hypothetical protein
MTYERIRVTREEDCAHVNMTTNYVRVSPTGMSRLECEVGVFILMSDIPALIAGLQAASDDEDAEYYADSEIDPNYEQARADQ